MPQSPNDKIQFALIGSGGMGQGDARNAIDHGGAHIVAAADLYDSRLARMKESFGSHVFTTRDYREVLARKDVDAVIIATPDLWHSRISIDAMNAGKDVYCQKPMVQKIAQGYDVIAAQKKTGRIFMVGSQYVSSQTYHKAKQLLASGAIGELNMVESWLDRNSAIGAWQYSIPPDASPATVDWDRYLGDIAPKRPFDAKRFFRWRNYQDYGTGLAGDLYIHLLSGLHFAVNSLGPVRVFSTGGTRYWKDGRDVPDVNLALLDYPKTDTHPEFTLTLKVNFASGGQLESFGTRLIGSEGVLEIGYTTVSLSRRPRPVEPGYTIDTFTKATQQKYLDTYRKKYPVKAASPEVMRPAKEDVYSAGSGYSAHHDHHRAFWNAVRTRKPHMEDAFFGMRAAAPALLSNQSLYENRLLMWDPQSMKVVS
jgi:predicted dehydrogenase